MAEYIVRGADGVPAGPFDDAGLRAAIVARTQPKLLGWVLSGPGAGNTPRTRRFARKHFAGVIEKAGVGSKFTITCRGFTSINITVEVVAQYRNPFRDATITPGHWFRIDAGVDLAGEGPVHPVGRCEVTAVFDSGTPRGWNGWGYGSGVHTGGWVQYKLLEGKAAGHEVYLAEGVHPVAGLKKGDVLSGDDVIAHLDPLSPDAVETGWAIPIGGFNTGGNTMAQTGSDGNASYFGDNFNDLLKSLGAQGGGPRELPVKGPRLPAGWPTW